MRYLYLILSIQFVFTNLVSAGGPGQNSVCPAVMDDAQQILSAIHSLRDQLLKEKECIPIDENLKLIGEILSNKDWKDVRDQFKKSKAPELEGEKIEAIKSLIQRAAQSASESIALLSGSSYTCVNPDNQKSFLNKLSGVISEISTISGNVTGPYGMAVSLGGQFLASALIGIDNIFTDAYNFKDPETESLFMNQFCSFTEVQKDINDFLGLNERKSELDELKTYLDTKIMDMDDNCPECSAYILAWNTKSEADKIVTRIQEDTSLIELGQEEGFTNYTRCNQMVRAFHTDNSDFDQFIQLLKSYKNPMTTPTDQGTINKFVMASGKLKIHYPDLDKCLTLAPKEKVLISQDFNNLIRDEILPLNDEIFSQQLTTFRKAANNKYQEPLGDYITTCMLRFNWINAERDRVSNVLSDYNYSISAEKVLENKVSLENRFIKNLLPQFLKFLFKRNSAQIDDFNVAMKKLAATTKKINGYDSRVLLAENKRTGDIFRAALEQTKTANRYCEHIRYLLLSTPNLEKLCFENKNMLIEKYNKTAKLSPEIAKQIQDANLWEKNEEVYQTSRVEEYKNRIKRWIEVGNCRWRLKGDESCLHIQSTAL